MAEKSAQYPMVPWDTCIEFVEKEASFNLKAVSYGEVAKKYGLSSPTAKSFTSKVSTCKQFGLLTTSGGNTIQLTDTCKRILYPTGEDVFPIKKACFGMPSLYTKLIAAYDGKAVPNRDLLANILMNDHKIQKSVKDNAARVFIESAEQLGLIKGGILCYSNDETPKESHSPQPVLEDSSAEVQSTKSPANTLSEQSSIESLANQSDFITQAIPCASGKIARFILPVDATEDDLLLLRDIFDVLLRRKFKIDTKGIK